MEETVTNQSNTQNGNAKEKKRKSPRNRVKLTDTQSAKDFMSKLIYDAQSNEHPIAYYKNLAYMAQVFISVDRLVNEHKELKILVDDHISGIWRDVVKAFDKIEDGLEKLFKPKYFGLVRDEIRKQKSVVSGNVDFVRDRILGEIEPKIRKAPKEFAYGTPEWKAGIAKEIISSLPESEFSSVRDHANKIETNRAAAASKDEGEPNKDN